MQWSQTQRVGRMRKAALAAGTVQLLYGMFTVAPQIFGMNFSSAPGQAAFRLFTIVACLAFVTFFLGIVIVPVPNVGHGVRIASVVAATALTVENLPYAYHQIQGAIAVASESWLWKDHPLRQFAHVLGLAIPTLAEITMVVFLLVVFSRSLRAQDGKQDLVGRTRFLRVASLMVAAVFVIALGTTFFPVILASRPPTVSVVRLLLRFATLASFVAFYFVIGMNQRRDDT